MPKPLTDLQQAALEVMNAYPFVDGYNSRLCDAVCQLDKAFVAEVNASKPVGRPRTRPHDPAKGKSCMCIDCRKRRQADKLSADLG